MTDLAVTLTFITMCIVDRFIAELFHYLTNDPENKRSCGVIKQHNDKLESFGEFSFPWKITAWCKLVCLSEWETVSDLSIFNVTFSEKGPVSLEDACQKLIEKSKELPLLIRECKVVQDRVYIFLDRSSSIKRCFTDGGVDLEPRCLNNKKIYFSIDDYNHTDVSHYRLQLVSKIAEKFVINEGYNLISDEDKGDCIKVHFTCRSYNKLKGHSNVFCGPVISVKNGVKEKQTSTEEYLVKRTLDMELKAQHKYRIYITDENLWKKSIKEIGEACAIFDLLQIKPSHSVQISMFDGGIGCSKGASFILYNYARLTSIIKTFQQKVSIGLYSKLPDLNEVNFDLLNDNDEWAIIFNYMLTYNTMLQKCLDIRPNEFRISPHYLCSFLSSLVVKFSMYYRKIRVLLEPRDHLMPKIFARMHFLMLIHKLLNHGLSLLSIKPMSEM